VKLRPSPRGALPAPRRWLRFAFFLSLVAIVALAFAAGDVGMLGLAPALLIALLVSRRRYPGARLLVAMRARALQRSPRRGLSPLPATGRAVVPAPRGGMLLARSLAHRPPPRLLLAR